MIYQNQNNIWNNTSTSTKRFLPIPESVSKHLEPEPKLSDFTVIQELGSGSFGHVILAQHKITQVKYAIKAIDKRNTVNIKEMPYFIREIEIMYRVHHPCKSSRNRINNERSNFRRLFFASYESENSS